MRLSHLLASVPLMVGGCGDNMGPPPTAPDFDGLWLITSRTRPTEAGLETETRDGSPHAIRGDAVFTAADDSTGVWQVRLFVLDDGVVTAAPRAGTHAVVVEPDRWVLTDPEGAIAVYATALVDDRLRLTWDAGDPRGTATAPPTRWVLDRVPPWSTELVGAWDLVSVEYPTGTVPADICIGDEHGAIKRTMKWTFDPRLVVELVRTTFHYQDDLVPYPWPPPPCSYRLWEGREVEDGFAEHDGTTLRLWSFSHRYATDEVGRSEAQVFDVQLAGDVATLTRTSCLPLPDCGGDHTPWFDSTMEGLVFRRHIQEARPPIR